MSTLGKLVRAPFVCCLIMSSLAMAQGAPQMPRIEGESLAGKNVELPEAVSGKIAVLIFGFSKASKVPTNDWAKKISADFSSQPSLALYQLPVLEDVPRFVRGMVISGMRKNVSADARDHFVPILRGEAELKKLVGFSEPDDAYLVLLDKTGKIVDQRHGPYSATSYSSFRAVVDSQLAAQK